MWYEWFLDGLGTEIIMLLVGLLIGGYTGYKIGIKKNGIQKQKATDSAKQSQKLDVEVSGDQEGSGINGNLRQIQKAGSKSEQSQIGRISR